MLGNLKYYKLAKPAKSIFGLAHMNKSSRNTANILATRHLTYQVSTHHVTYHVSRDLSILIYRWYLVKYNNVVW